MISLILQNKTVGNKSWVYICSYHDKSMVKFLWSFLWKCKTKFFSWTKCIKNKQKKSLSFQIEIHVRIVWTPSKWVLSLITELVIEKSGNIHNIIIWYIYPKTHCFFIIDVWKSEPIDIGIQKYIYVLLCTFMCPTQSHNTSKSIQEQYGSKVLLC